MNRQERKAMQLVARYQKVNRQIGEVGKEKLDRKMAKNKNNATFLKLEQLKLKRNQLAYQIIKNKEQCSKALDFYGLGKATAHFNQSISNKDIQHANQRRYKLQRYAYDYKYQQHLQQVNRKPLRIPH